MTEQEWLAIGYSKHIIEPMAVSDVSITLRDIYEAWIVLKETPRNKSNIKRIKASWKSYYAEEPLSQDVIDCPVCSLTSLTLREWAEKLLKKHYPVDKKKFSRMFGIMNQCFEYACDDDIHYLYNNVWEKAKRKINPLLITGKPLPLDEEQVFSDAERLMLYDMVCEDMGKYGYRPTSAGLQILFLFETGLRIGEVCGLKWSDVRGSRLLVRRQANNETVMEWTKSNSGYREIPLTDNALHILRMVAAYNQEHGFDKAWIFQGNNPNYDYRLGYHSAGRKLRKLCKRMDTYLKSPHKCRKTCISTLLDCPDVSDRTVQRFAGHKDLSTTFKYYCFERKTKEEQAKVIDNALKVWSSENKQ